MIKVILSFILSTIFILLSLIHLYWLFGGKWGLKNVIPTNSKQDSSKPPPKVATFIVALILTIFGLIYLEKSDFINIKVPYGIARHGLWIIPSIFTLRAIGEFKYVGFFKKIKNTAFAKADTKWFSPLCLIIGIVGIMIYLMDK